MRSRFGVIVLLWLIAATGSFAATTRYVDVNSTRPEAPYTSWETAATVIQDAIEAGEPGDLVLVTNGVYETGGKVVYGTITNRVAVTKPLVLQSVNGPEKTTILGYQLAGATNGPGAVRCVYLTNGATLAGFTVSNGATLASGDQYKEMSGGGIWSESTGSVISNCVVTGSAAVNGGGAFRGLFLNCTLADNRSTKVGGGGYSNVLSGSLVLSNVAGIAGGGLDGAFASNCTIVGNNTAGLGGGASSSALLSCQLSGNWVTAYGVGPSRYGGGARSCRLTNCVVTGNSAASGGGISESWAVNCTITGNLAYEYGGGMFGVSAYNTILAHNRALLYDDNYNSTALHYCCSSPLASGAGNIDADPALSTTSHLSAGSPCRGAGNPSYSQGTDIDGDPWATPPSIGCDEFVAGSNGGGLSVAIQAASTSVAAGFPLDLAADVSGRTTASRWEFGDGTIISNQPYASHQWVLAGDYSVVLRAYNDSHPDGVNATSVIHVLSQPTHYVSLDSATPAAPYTSWSTAATNIQDAVDAVTVIGATVLVSNGVYNTGGRALYGGMTNRVSITTPMIVKSLNGPWFTAIEGGARAMRSVFAAPDASLSGFTLRKGSTKSGFTGQPDYNQERSGGGVWCPGATVSSCVITGNVADTWAGGAYGGTLKNCILARNGITGAYRSRLENCTAVSNPHGADFCVIVNSIIYSNTATNSVASSFAFSCTTPAASGPGNITNPPAFANFSGSDFRLSSASPCINSGINAYLTTTDDLDGGPRIAGGTADMGAFEFPSPSSQLSYAWLQQYGLPIDGSADFADADLDSFNNYQEWIAGTSPTDATSALRILSATTNSVGIEVTWQSVTNRSYWLERRTDLSPESAFVTVGAAVPGQAASTTLTDTNVVGQASLFYRVRVGLPY